MKLYVVLVSAVLALTFVVLYRSRFNIANKITLFRFAMGLEVLTTLGLIEKGWWSTDSSIGLWITLALFVPSMVLDVVDGFLARHLGIETAFGSIADTIIDKVVVTCSLISLSAIPESRSILETWMVITVVIREFTVMSIRAWFEGQRIKFPAERAGKNKMVVQAIAISGLIFVAAVGPAPPWLVLVVKGTVWWMLYLTITSLVFYVRKAIALGVKHKLPI